jgi:hypothetical protein
MDRLFNIFNKEKVSVGVVSAKSSGEAKNKAVSQKLVAGKKQISKVEQLEYDDPYEQNWEDVYGS